MQHQSSSATHVMKEALGKANDQIERVGETIHDVAEQARTAVGPALEEMETVWSDTLRYTRKNPARALGVAALGGLALGAILTLFGRRD